MLGSGPSIYISYSRLIASHHSSSTLRLRIFFSFQFVYSVVCPGAIGYSQGVKGNFMRLDSRRVDAVRNSSCYRWHARLIASLDFCHKAYYADSRKIPSYEYDVLPHPITLGIVGTLHSQVDVARRENQHHGLASLNG